MSANDSTPRVVRKSPEDYGDDFQDHLLEQYKIVRGRIVDIINDRNSQSNFLFAILTALLAVPGYLFKEEFTAGSLDLIQALIVLPFPRVWRHLVKELGRLEQNLRPGARSGLQDHE